MSVGDGTNIKGPIIDPAIIKLFQSWKDKATEREATWPPDALHLAQLFDAANEHIACIEADKADLELRGQLMAKDLASALRHQRELADDKAELLAALIGFEQCWRAEEYPMSYSELTSLIARHEQKT
jgi:hypothetical protein